MTCPEPGCGNPHAILFKPAGIPRQAGFWRRLFGKGPVYLERSGLILVCGVCTTQYLVTNEGVRKIRPRALEQAIRSEVRGAIEVEKDRERERESFPWTRK